ncbi:archaeosortase/exosortase family protein [Hymenobacter sp. NST-14]|nr:archaeosortase/exosortase family protein [Hymenobacter piscis]
MPGAGAAVAFGRLLPVFFLFSSCFPMLATSTISATAPDRRPLGRFLLVAGGLYLLWFFGYERTLAPAGHLDEALSRNLAAAGSGLLRLLGFATWPDAAQPRLLRMDGLPGVWVGDPCNGLVLYALFAGFVLALPGGGWRRKLAFIPAGIGVIYLLNVLRVAALALNHHYYRQSVEFNHHYTFTFVVYGAILLLWAWWVRQLPRAAAVEFSSTTAAAAR